MGQVHVWQYIRVVERNLGAVLLINSKTELRITLDKCAYTEYFASGIGPMGPIGTQ
jgi:predicted nucleic-acid-binding Zn-ribbon protein